MLDLGNIVGAGSEGLGINNAGEVVGTILTSSYVYNTNKRQVTDLSGINAYDINDSGQIVGSESVGSNGNIAS